MLVCILTLGCQNTGVLYRLLTDKDAVQSFRARCCELGLLLRPQLFPAEDQSPEAPEQKQQQQAAEAEATSTSAGSPEKVRTTYQDSLSESQRWSPRSLATTPGHQSTVIVESAMLHPPLKQALEGSLLGYIYMWRIEEIWSLLSRSQKFHNWFSKLSTASRCHVHVFRVFRCWFSFLASQ